MDLGLYKNVLFGKELNNILATSKIKLFADDNICVA